jgi:hypothetical protein
LSLMGLYKKKIFVFFLVQLMKLYERFVLDLGKLLIVW